MRPLALYGLVAAGVVVADQAIKALVVATMDLYEAIELLPFLALYHTRNTGVAFSMFSGSDDWRLVVLALVVTAFIGWLAWRSDPRQIWARLGFALIIGGAIGNLIDRAVLGYVVDYVFFHTPVWSFAVFNLADMAITCGAALVIWQEFSDWRRERWTGTS